MNYLVVLEETCLYPEGGGQLVMLAQYILRCVNWMSLMYKK